MAQPSKQEISNAVKRVKAEANKKFGDDWRLVISNEGGPKIEARRMTGNVVQSIVWLNGRIENRTFVAKG